MTVQAVCEQTKEGRGLWAGVFLKEYPNDTIGQKKHPLRSYMPEKPHLTLAHFGKNNSPERAVAIYNALSLATVEVLGGRDFEMEITGIALFWRRDAPLPVALVNSSLLFDLRASFLAHLWIADVGYDDRYGFIPHLTLNTTGLSYETVFSERGSSTGSYADRTIANAGAIKVATHGRPRLVCGDAWVSA